MMPQSLSMQTSVISIQSQVVYGHVGNSAAVLPMQARGLNVAAVPTTLLSNHPGYATMRGRVLEPELVSDLLRGVEERGLIETSRYIVSGYLGSRANGEVVADFVKRARKINPEITYICDPVMGDTGLGVFVADPVVECIINQLVPLADLLTPNQFEVGLITKSEPTSFAVMEEKVRQIQVFNNARVVATGCVFPDTPYGSLENVVFEGALQTRLTSPRVPVVPVGTGDLFTGLLTADLVHGCSLTDAARNAAATVLRVVGRMAAHGEQEMQLGSAIDALLSD
ncbi:pyridoxal kinase [Pseudochrobactrum sp. sp1633]|uniref:pyridoxal kinase n=1 Tax=Pseudochrobactrum sp. sp1633 TaxID=3036706 RepID=UPI0035B54025